MTFDDILQNYIEFGRYQKRIYLLLCIPSIFVGIFTLLPIFILITPDHRCHLDNLDNDTFAYQSEAHKQLVEMYVPKEKQNENELSKCLLYDGDWDNSTNSLNRSKSSCDEWVYDTSVKTAVSEFNLVCDDSIYQSHFKMITFFGGLLGAFVNGLLADIYGRKNVFLVCLAIFIVVTVVLVVSPFYSLFLTMRFFQGFSGIGTFLISFVMVMELVGPSYRLPTGMVFQFFVCTGHFVLVGAAYFIHDWKYLLLAVCLPGVGILSYFFIIPESPRWLLSRDRIDEAEAILKKAADENGTKVPERTVLERAKELETEGNPQHENESGRVWKLFTHRVLMIRMIIIFINRFSVNMAYYGFWLNIEDLSGDVYLNFTITSIVETLANVFIFIFINRLGRKSLYFGSIMTSALGFLLTLIPLYLGSKTNNVFTFGLMMIGKFGNTAAYSIMFVYMSELVPTSLRNSAMGLSQCIEFMGGATSPYITDIGKLFDERSSKAFPMIVFGSLSLVVGIFSLLLPETRNKQLPETVAEAVTFGQHEEL